MDNLIWREPIFLQGLFVIIRGMGRLGEQGRRGNHPLQDGKDFGLAMVSLEARPTRINVEQSSIKATPAWQCSL